MTRPPPTTIETDTCRQDTPVTLAATSGSPANPGHTARRYALDERSQNPIDLKGVITNAIEIENLTGRIFRLLQGTFLADHPRASHVFAKLAEDEADHEATLMRQRGLMETRPEMFTPIDAALGHRQRVLILQLGQSVQRIETTALTLDDALQLCLEIEEGDGRMIADLRGALGTFAFGTTVIEVLAMHKHPEHNAGLITMARERGVGKLPKREPMDTTTITPRPRDDQWPKIQKAMIETRNETTEPVLGPPGTSPLHKRDMRDTTL